MEETAGNPPAPAAGRNRLRAIGIGHHRERRVVALGLDARIMEFVPAQPRAASPEATIGSQPGLAISQMQFSPGETRRYPQKIRHRMDGAVCVGHCCPQYHVSAALAVDGSRGGKVAKLLEEVMRSGQPPGVKFGIAARQPAGVAVAAGSLIGQRREEPDFRPGGPPALQQVRIEEGERLVAGNGDALPGRRDGGVAGKARATRPAPPPGTG